MKKDKANQWISTDEVQDVAGSIRHAVRVAAFVADDTQAWKWFALALHSALQGACVCHLTTSASPLGAVTKANAREWLAYFEEGRTDPSAYPPATYLMGLPLLLKAIRKPLSAGDHQGPGVAISDAELAWLCRFHRDIRNQFVHFEPRGWSIEVSGLPAIASLIARIVGEIDQIGYGFRHATVEERAKLQSDLQSLAKLTIVTAQ